MSSATSAQVSFRTEFRETPRQIALACLGKAREQPVGDRKPEDPVAEEFQALVALAPPPRQVRR